MDILKCDIETAPLPDTLGIAHTFDPSTVKYGNAKRQELRDEILIKAEEDFWVKKEDRLALDPHTAEVCAIGYLDDDGITLTGFSGESEKELLQGFWARTFPDHDNNAIEHHKIIGWSFLGFDLPFIWKRSLINGIRMPLNIRRGRYWNDRFVDLMLEWTNYEHKQFYSLKNACKTLGIDIRKEDEVQGKFFHEYLRSEETGKVEKAKQYLTDDLIETDLIGRAMGL